MDKLLSILAGWKGYAAAGVVSAALASGAAWYLTALPYRVEVASLKAQAAEQASANSQAALSAFRAQAASINDAARQLAQIETGLSSTYANLSQGFQTYAKQNPLPVDCKPDAFRVRALSAAVAAANAAAAGRQAGGGLPANP